MISFDDLMTKLNDIKTKIISNMVYETDDMEIYILEFNKHIHTTKSWYTKISYANKKQYLLALLRDVKSAWAISLLLKAIWNCQTKDAIMSAYEKVTLSPYDQVPLDNNRNAMPEAALAQTMLDDRKWFNQLNSENQATVLIELLTVSGGPLVREVLNEARRIYEKYRREQVESIESVVSDTEDKHNKDKDKAKIDLKEKTALEREFPPQLETQLTTWNSLIKSFRDGLKFEELEVNLVDGTRKKIWKINRPRPETLETVDYLQLIPSPIAKRILSFVPPSQLSECSKVNKYWASLVDELKSEQNTRTKIDVDLMKLRALIETTNSLLERENTLTDDSAFVSLTNAETSQPKLAPSAQRLVKKKRKNVCKPLRVSEITEKLDRRGAADENLFSWCERIVKLTEKTSLNEYKVEGPERAGGTLGIHVPLSAPLTRDPITSKKNAKVATITHEALPPTEASATSSTSGVMDFSTKYPVGKILSYEWPL